MFVNKSDFQLTEKQINKLHNLFGVIANKRNNETLLIKLERTSNRYMITYISKNRIETFVDNVYHRFVSKYIYKINVENIRLLNAIFYIFETSKFNDFIDSLEAYND